ncbi:MAG: glycoside hydrolase family 3 C-terminal domain-containing protein [Flexilinea sp.]
MEKDKKIILSHMSLEEKAAICSGLNLFSMKGFEKLEIPSLKLSDGPHGLRKQDKNLEVGLNASIKATCFPTEATLACSFDRELIEKVGESLGEECQAEDIAILLGPAVNIKRSPACGRNFEYFSEDPYLTSELAISYINGVQSKGVGTSIKHFAANNQEDLRLSVDVQIDERTLREIYLASFEMPIKKAHPWTVMCAYNKLNGVYCSENKYLLNDILRDEWNFDGFVMSDWGAVAHRVEGIKAGLDLEMPPSGKLNDKNIIDAVDQGKLSISDLDKVVEHILNVIIQTAEIKKKRIPFDVMGHHNIAKEAALESMVLLKNENGILPLDKNCNLAIIGAMAKIPRYQGAGSSHVNPVVLDVPFEKIIEKTTHITYADGYDRNRDIVDETLIEEAIKAAAKSDITIVFAGLIEEYESEGFDRTHIKMPESHNRLIEAVSSVQPKTVVVLSNGAPIEMLWVDKVKGLLEAYLGGQALGSAIADILFGDANPCGKLAETFPMKLSHNPSFINFPGMEGKVEYKEGLFVGYRYYDIKEITPLFPFGFGLSYSNFEYTGISLSKVKITDKETVQVSVKIKNIGKMAGKEIVQLYISKPESRVIRPLKELKGFKKVYLEPGQEKEVSFSLDKRSFSYYNTKIMDWYVESGLYNIIVASSSKDLRLVDSITVESTVILNNVYTRYTTMGELMDDGELTDITQELIKYLSIKGAMLDNLKDNPKMGWGMLKGLALCTLYSSSNGSFTEEKLQEILERLNSKNNISQN